MSGDVADGGAAIDYEEARGFGGGEREVAFADAVVEGGAFVVDARFGRAEALVAAFGAVEAGFEIDIDEDGGGGAEALAGDAVEIEDDGGVEAAAAALVDEGGVGEAVAEDDAAGVERGADDFVDVLGAAGEVEEEFGARLDGGTGGVEQDAADLAADFGAAGFDGFDDFAAVFAEILGEQAELRGFAAAVYAFEGEEVALRCQEASIFADGEEWAGD